MDHCPPRSSADCFLAAVGMLDPVEPEEATVTAARLVRGVQGLLHCRMRGC